MIKPKALQIAILGLILCALSTSTFALSHTFDRDGVQIFNGKIFWDDTGNPPPPPPKPTGDPPQPTGEPPPPPKT